MENKDLAAILGLLPKAVSLWRRRFAEQKLAGIEKEALRGGRPATLRNRVAKFIMKNANSKPSGNSGPQRTLLALPRS